MSESKFFNPSTRETGLKFSFHAEMKRFRAKLYETVSVFFFFFAKTSSMRRMDRRFSCRRPLYCLFIYPVALLDAQYLYLLSFAFSFFFKRKLISKQTYISRIILYSNIYWFDKESTRCAYQKKRAWKEIKRLNCDLVERCNCNKCFQLIFA